MLIDAMMVVNDLKEIRKSCTKSSGPYWLKIAPKTPLEGLEIEYAKLTGFEPWDVWREAVYASVKGSKRDRREFLSTWLDDLDHARTVSGKVLDNTAIWLPVWR